MIFERLRKMTANIEQYRIFEMIVDVANTEDIPRAVFTMGDNQKSVFGFKFGTHQMMIRFSPDRTGLWQYSIRAGKKEIEGEFMCIPCSPSNHGPVKTSGMHFEYADGTRFLPFGTTCYAWTYPQENIRWQTLQSLQAAPFNKVRMCLFPKSMIYNEEMPSQYPFLRDDEGLWDMDQPDTEFWKDFENQIQRLDDIGIEADVILFHPYDCWGFAKLTREESLKYLEYCIRRLSPYKNVWWSLGNEYDLMAGKTEEDWEVFAEKILREDVYGHLMSIHHCLKSYPLKPWMTHFSVQTKGTGIALSLSMQNKIPVIIEECGY